MQAWFYFEEPKVTFCMFYTEINFLSYDTRQIECFYPGFQAKKNAPKGAFKKLGIKNLN